MPLKVQYKCRKCGKIEERGSVPEFLDIVKIIQEIPDVNNPHYFLVGFHYCEDDSIGVTDFIGAENYIYGEQETSS